MQQKHTKTEQTSRLTSSPRVTKDHKPRLTYASQAPLSSPAPVSSPEHLQTPVLPLQMLSTAPSLLSFLSNVSWWLPRSVQACGSGFLWWSQTDSRLRAISELKKFSSPPLSLLLTFSSAPRTTRSPTEARGSAPLGLPCHGIQQHL